jgi:predicted O-methyltransferase YrrM
MTSTPQNLSSAPSPDAQRSHHPGRYSFDEAWFEHRRPAWEQHLRPLGHQQLNILEIGAFEGASTTWMLDHLAHHENSSVTSVDTFEGGIDYKVTEMASYQANTLKDRFLRNVDACANRRKLRVMATTSEEALLQLRGERRMFHIVYIDGSHTAADVLSDAVLAWPMLNEGGLMIFDDLNWNEYTHEAYTPGPAIAGFIRCMAPHVDAMAVAGQMWVQRTPCRIPAERRRPAAN